MQPTRPTPEELKAQITARFGQDVYDEQHAMAIQYLKAKDFTGLVSPDFMRGGEGVIIRHVETRYESSHEVVVRVSEEQARLCIATYFPSHDDTVLVRVVATETAKLLWQCGSSSVTLVDASISETINLYPL